MHVNCIRDKLGYGTFIGAFGCPRVHFSTTGWSSINILIAVSDLISSEVNRGDSLPVAEIDSVMTC